MEQGLRLPQVRQAWKVVSILQVYFCLVLESHELAQQMGLTM